jgi:hypothetical protein
MHWLIHDALLGDRLEEMLNVIEQRQDTAEILSGRALGGYPPPSDQPMGFLVTVQVARQLAQQGHVGLLWSGTAYNTLSYASGFSRWLLNDDLVWLPWAELVRRGPASFAHMAVDGHIFIRPDSGQKVFTGQLLSLETFHDQVKLIDMTSGVYASTLIAVSRPKPIDADIEWRFWLGREGVCAVTPYSWDKERTNLPAAPDDVVALAHEVAAYAAEDGAYVPDHLFVADFCLSNGAPKLIELNAASCSGLYQANLSQVLAGIENAVRYHMGEFDAEVAPDRDVGNQMKEIKR